MSDKHLVTSRPEAHAASQPIAGTKDKEMTSEGLAGESLTGARSVTSMCLQKSQPLSEYSQLQVESDQLCWGASGVNPTFVYSPTPETRV